MYAYADKRDWNNNIPSTEMLVDTGWCTPSLTEWQSYSECYKTTQQKRFTYTFLYHT